MSESAEELKIELRERLEDAYRISPNSQIGLYIFLELIILIALYEIHIGLIEGIVVFLFSSAIIYPAIIKVRNFYSELIALALFGATILVVALYIVDNILNTELGLNNPNTWMAIIFLLIFGVELFHHMYEKAKFEASLTILIFNLILTAIFAFATYELLVSANLFSFETKLAIVALAAFFYFFAIKHETPY